MEDGGMFLFQFSVLTRQFEGFLQGYPRFFDPAQLKSDKAEHRPVFRVVSALLPGRPQIRVSFLGTAPGQK